MKLFENKVAIVTGAASGIGRALAVQLGQEGTRTILLDKDGPRLEDAAREAGARSHVVVDVRDFDAVKRAIESAFATEGRLDFLFNNAGMGVIGEARDYGIEHWREVIDTDLNGVMHGVAVAYPRMVEQGHGHIINTSSLAGLVPVPAACSYVAAKFGVVGLSVALRMEAQQYGVRVSCVCPAAVDTRVEENGIWVNVDIASFRATRPGKPMSAERCAREILRGVERNDELILPGSASAIAFTHRHTPVVTRTLMRSLTKKFHQIRAKNLAR